ncbi:MAG TPA: cbb3-type cytochrome c oxidase subunit I [Thermoanaerobaculia bacterium]|nr:cbb3-type cytochrome c oxidase subunit I [Thermoanaerobaculia bacterium]
MPKRQLRVGTQWLYVDEAEKILKGALRIREEEQRQLQLTGHVQSWWRRYVFSTDHKWIGIQYAVTALCFLMAGFGMMLLMRFQLAWPGRSFHPWIAQFLGAANAPGGIMLPEFYNQLGAMHGTVMVFLAIVPLAVGAFGNYVVPLQIGAPDMAFPKLNMMSYWLYLPGGLIMLSSFFIAGGAANSGWTSYPPLSVIATRGQDIWLLGMVLLITSSLLGAVNFIVTIIQLRAKGLTWMRLPFFVWAQLVTSFLLLLAFPPLEAAAVMQLSDRLFETSFFMPSGLVISGTPLERDGGGNPLLWQHLFWFLAHPEVYVLILPGLGIIAEVIANNTRKPLWGYRSLVYSVVFLGFMSFVVWAHHMFMTGMGTAISAFFQTTTMIISIPSVIILSALLITLWGGSIRLNTPMMFALAFLPMFAIGGLTGLPLGLAASDIHLHDTYYVIGHFHYVVAPGTIFAMFAGIYYWFPKVTGRQMSERLGKMHFWGSLIFINGVFFPMFLQGLAGVSRRLYDGGAQYAHAKPVLHWNLFMSVSAFLLLAAQLPFIVNFFKSILWGEKVGANPWEATTLEWAATTSPPLGHGNFATVPVVYRGPYEYNFPGHDLDYYPQNLPDPEQPVTPAPPAGGGLPQSAVAQKES